MQFSQTKPSNPGLFWHAYRGLRAPQVIRVANVDGTLMALGYTTPGYRQPLATTPGWFAGPILDPPVLNPQMATDLSAVIEEPDALLVAALEARGYTVTPPP